ncbi:MAG: glucosyltransferase [Vezdaea aestivalis]|nr:MAG: glucosyltransferase [Vezdaea aestivalis]
MALKAQRRESFTSLHSSYLPVVLLAATSAIWFGLVSQIVTEPYLDEVFHIRQAQAYLARQWHVWDPKITTPPGLYILSLPLLPFYDRSHSNASIPALRALNLLCLTVFLPYQIYRLRRALLRSWGVSKSEVDALHVAASVSLFPPLFFFGALYYTDPWSTFWVLLTVDISGSVGEVEPSGRWVGPATVASGIIALAFRQTNVFWVAVYAGVKEVVRVTKAEEGAGERLTAGQSWFEVYALSWCEKRVYDPLVGEAAFQDYLKAILSLGLNVVHNIVTIIRRVLPHLTLLLLFGLFILINGSVVLGDKSNHTATLHLAQLLYLWPYIAFFSAPLLLPSVLSLLPSRLLHSSLLPLPPSPLAILVPALLAIPTIHFSTQIHPFLRADNRHYPFYIMRYFILSHPLIRYAWAPLYAISSWAVLSSLAIPTPRITAPAKRKVTPRLGAPPSGPTVSDFLAFLLPTVLTLGSAPLVEPRYSILPWVMWRLHVPPCGVRVAAGSRKELAQDREGESWLAKRLIRFWRIRAEGLELVWFVLINAVCGYMFLCRGFEWSSEKGALQRFMW